MIRRVVDLPANIADLGLHATTGLARLVAPDAYAAVASSPRVPAAARRYVAAPPAYASVASAVPPDYAFSVRGAAPGYVEGSSSGDLDALLPVVTMSALASPQAGWFGASFSAQLRKLWDPRDLARFSYDTVYVMSARFPNNCYWTARFREALATIAGVPTWMPMLLVCAERGRAFVTSRVHLVGVEAFRDHLRHEAWGHGADLDEVVVADVANIDRRYTNGLDTRSRQPLLPAFL